MNSIKILLSYFFITLNVLAFKNISIKNCDHYPYYGISQNKNGSEILLDNLRVGIDRLDKCLNSDLSHSYLRGKFDDLIEILNSDDVKTFECTQGVYNSFYAVASYPEGHKNSSKNEDLGMAQHPSVLLDVNRIAGNFPLFMEEAQRQKIERFYNFELSLDEIIGGKRNPFYGRTENPTSLLIHEALHWTESYHFNIDYPDIVYLSQICCFDIANIDKSVRASSCEILYDKDLWSENKQKRLDLMSFRDIRAEVTEIIKLYHTHSNKAGFSRRNNSYPDFIPFMK